MNIMKYICIWISGLTFSAACDNFLFGTLTNGIGLLIMSFILIITAIKLHYQNKEEIK